MQAWCGAESQGHLLPGIVQLSAQLTGPLSHPFLPFGGTNFRVDCVHRSLSQGSQMGSPNSDKGCWEVEVMSACEFFLALCGLLPDDRSLHFIRNLCVLVAELSEMLTLCSESTN